MTFSEAVEQYLQASSTASGTRNTALMSPAWMSRQIGSTSAPSLIRTSAMPRPFSICTEPGTTEPMTASSVSISWTFRNGAPAFSRSNRTWAGSRLSSSSSGSPKKLARRTRALADRITSTARGSLSTLFGASSADRRRAGSSIIFSMLDLRLELLGDPGLLPLRDWLAEDNHKVRAIVALTVACCGFAAGFAYDRFVNPGHSATSHFVVGSVGAVGAAMPGYFLSGLFGRNGVIGWIVAFGSAWLCSIIGGFLGGTLLFPGIGSLFGLFVAAMWFARPETAIAWIVGLIVTHLITLKIRRLH